MESKKGQYITEFIEKVNDEVQTSFLHEYTIKLISAIRNFKYVGASKNIVFDILKYNIDYSIQNENIRKKYMKILISSIDDIYEEDRKL